MSMLRGGHTIPQDHQNYLRRLAKIGKNDPIPQDLQDFYWKWKYTSDRLGEAMTGQSFVFIGIVTGYGAEPPPPPGLLDRIRTGEVPRETPVEAEFRGNVIHGRIQGVDMSLRMVQVMEDATGQVRNVTPDSVKIVEAVET